MDASGEAVRFIRQEARWRADGALPRNDDMDEL
jgi:hypothetical protein